MDERLWVPATAVSVKDWTGPAWADSPTLDRVQTVIVDGAMPNFPCWLDLSRAECRDRVARVVAEDHGLDTRNGVAWTHRGGRSWSIRGAAPTGMRAGSPPMDAMERRFVVDMTQGMHHLAKRRGMDKLWWLVPALAGLDPTDDTRLPDGSRRVDALALAACYKETP